MVRKCLNVRTVRKTESLYGLWAEIEENRGNCSAQVNGDREGWLDICMEKELQPSV